MTEKFNYGQIVKTARRMIARFGTKVSVVIALETPAAQSWQPGAPKNIELDVDAVFSNEEKKFMFCADDLKLPDKVTGHIQRGTERWTIKDIATVNPGGTVIVYSALVTK